MAALGRRLLVCVALAGLGGPSQALAGDSPTSPEADPTPQLRNERWGAELAAGVVLPVLVGAQATLDMPHRLLAQLELGFLPSPFVDLAKVAAGTHAHDDAALVRAALGNSLVLRLGAGWRPLPRAGLEITGGYTLATLGGGVAPASLVEGVAGVQLGRPDEAGGLPIHSTLHGLYAGASWRFDLGECWLARVGVSFEHVLSSRSGIDLLPAAPEAAAALRRAGTALDRHLNLLYRRRAAVPALTLMFGYKPA
jgi:hypothetical protein